MTVRQSTRPQTKPAFSHERRLRERNRCIEEGRADARAGARILRTRDRSAPLPVAGTERGHVAPPPDAVEAQQRFLAYAAHELRGAIALQRTLAEVTLADQDGDTAALQEMGERVVAACERQERLLDALLTLARRDADVCGGRTPCAPIAA
jgi:signal transduction histidine kinase